MRKCDRQDEMNKNRMKFCLSPITRKNSRNQATTACNLFAKCMRNPVARVYVGSKGHQINVIVSVTFKCVVCDEHKVQNEGEQLP